MQSETQRSHSWQLRVLLQDASLVRESLAIYKLKCDKPLLMVSNKAATTLIEIIVTSLSDLKPSTFVISGIFVCNSVSKNNKLHVHLAICCKTHSSEFILVFYRCQVCCLPGRTR